VHSHELRAGPDNGNNFHDYPKSGIDEYFVLICPEKSCAQGRPTYPRPTTQTILLRSFFETFGTFGTTELTPFWKMLFLSFHGTGQKHIGNTFIQRPKITTNDSGCAGFPRQELPEKVFSCAALPQPRTWISWVGNVIRYSCISWLLLRKLS
jgi:hypothetical protein